MVFYASQEDIARALSGEKVTIAMSDADAAHDVRRVFKSLNPPIKVAVSGRNVVVPGYAVEKVRSYLRGEISVNEYRDRMPEDYYSWKGDIYQRQ